MNPWLLSIPLAYLLGSIPFGYLLVRIFRHQDIRATGSGNIGATNVARSGAKGLAIATLILDLGKGFLAVLLAYAIAHHTGMVGRTPWHQDDNLAMAAAIAAVVGHVFPVWLGFQGGKGVATALGVLLALMPLEALCVFAIFLLVFALTRYVSLASILACASLPIVFAYLSSFPAQGPVMKFGLFFIPFLIIAKHHANIRRLLAGTESRFGRSSANKAAA